MYSSFFIEIHSAEKLSLKNQALWRINIYTVLGVNKNKATLAASISYIYYIIYKCILLLY